MEEISFIEFGMKQKLCLIIENELTIPVKYLLQLFIYPLFFLVTFFSLCVIEASSSDVCEGPISVPKGEETHEY